MKLEPSRATLSRLKVIASDLKEAWARLQTELGTITDKESSYAFKMRLSIIMEEPYNSEFDEWKAKLVADTLSRLSELASLWKLKEDACVYFTDERWTFCNKDSDGVIAIVQGVESRYAVFAIKTAIAADSDGTALCGLIATLMPQATYKGLKFCEYFIDQIEKAPF